MYAQDGPERADGVHRQRFPRPGGRTLATFPSARARVSLWAGLCRDVAGMVAGQADLPARPSTPIPELETSRTGEQESASRAVRGTSERWSMTSMRRVLSCLRFSDAKRWMRKRTEPAGAQMVVSPRENPTPLSRIGPKQCDCRPPRTHTVRCDGEPTLGRARRRRGTAGSVFLPRCPQILPSRSQI